MIIQRTKGSIWYKFIGISVLTLIGTSGVFAQEIKVNAGTEVPLLLTKDVSSADAERGQKVPFVVELDVVIDGQVIVKKGTEATGTVIYAEKGGYMGKSGKLAIQVESTLSADGKLLPLIAAKGSEGESKSGRVLALSYIAGPFAMLKKGGNTVVKEGTKISVFTAEPRSFRFDGTSLVAGETIEAVAAPTGASVTVIIFRPKKFVGSGLEPSVFCDGIELGRMDNGRYITLKLTPGKHIVHMTDEKKGYEMNMAAGQTYYFRVGIEAGAWKGHGKLLLEENAAAETEIKKLKPLDADKIKDKTLVVPGE